LRVEGTGFRVQGSGFRVQGPGSRVQGSGFRVQDLVAGRRPPHRSPTVKDGWGHGMRNGVPLTLTTTRSARPSEGLSSISPSRVPVSARTHSPSSNLCKLAKKMVNNHPEGNSGANLKSISQIFYLFEVAFVSKLTKETIVLPLSCLPVGPFDHQN